MTMASNYTCRACSRALSRPSSSVFQTLRPSQKSTPRLPSAHRALSTSSPALYHASSPLSAEAKPAGPTPNKLDSPTMRVPKGGAMVGIAQKIREKAPVLTETYVAYGAARELMKECARPGDYTIPQALEKGGEIPTDATGAHIGVGTGWWYETLALTPTFINWAQITFIHMYMLQVRFRMLPATHGPLWIQHLTNHAFYAAEDRLVLYHKLNSNSVRQKYLKDLFSQWRAVLLSYDEGLVKGDAALAAAVWRNLFAAREDVDFEKLAQVVGYMRRELRRLDKAKDDEAATGLWTFQGDPGEVEELVRRTSRLMTSEGTATAA